MVSELENIEGLERELLKVRLTITEKNQEVEILKKSAKIWGGLWGIFGGSAIIAYFAEKTPVAIGLLIAGLPFVFVGMSKEFKAMKINGEVNSKKKKKKQLENKIRKLLYLAKVNAKKEKENIL